MNFTMTVFPGKYFLEKKRMHELYGPIVRVSPHEVHIRDSKYFGELYSNTLKLDKCSWFYNFVACPGATVATASSDLHRARRGALAKYFSTSNVALLEPLLNKCLSKLVARLQEHKEKMDRVNLSNAYRCIATDGISEYALPRSRLLLDTPDFAADEIRVLRDFARTAVWNRHLNFVPPLFNAIPRWIVERLDPGPSLAVFDNQTFLRDSATTVVSSKGLATAKSKSSVLQQIYNSDLPASEKTTTRLTQEALTLLGAGTETTGNTLTLTTFYLLADHVRLERLKKELSEAKKVGEAAGSLLRYQDLQKLPYLTVVITESLRISSSVPNRLPRVNHTAPMLYKSFNIPAGTAVSMSIRDVLLDESILEDAHKFKPKRWLGDFASKQALEKYFVPFSRGPRNCVGMNLAMAELYLVIGNLFRDFDMQLYNTKGEDLTIAHDFFSPFGPLDSKGLRVKVG